MKQRKFRTKQKRVTDTWKKRTPLCFVCHILLLPHEYIFCAKCRRDLDAAGTNPERLAHTIRVTKQELP